MSDIVTTIKGAVCLPDTGCVSVVTCICDIMQDAADEIERLREALQKIEYLERPQVRGMPRRVSIHDIAHAALVKEGKHD